MLAVLAENDKVLKLWHLRGDSWHDDYSLTHESIVTSLAWCSSLGSSVSPYLTIGMWVEWQQHQGKKFCSDEKDKKAFFILLQPFFAFVRTTPIFLQEKQSFDKHYETTVLASKKTFGIN